MKTNHTKENMATIKKWEDVIKSTDPRDLSEIAKALEKLRKLELFERTYPEMAMIRIMIESVLVDYLLKITNSIDITKLKER